MLRPLVTDRRELLLCSALAVAGTSEILLLHVGYERAIFIPLALIVPAALLWRTRYPLAVMALNIGAWIVIDLFSPANEDPLTLAVALAIAVYSVGAHTTGYRAVVGAGLVAGMALLATFVDWDSGTLLDLFGNLFFFTGIFGGVWLGGRAMHRRRRRERDLILEREEKARAAVVEERARIARELHDVVAHAISVIVLQARGARHAVASDTEKARGALDAIEQTASQALAEMRRLLAMLRADDEAIPLAPQPSLAHLETLADQVRNAGLPVQLTFEGERRELPPGIDLAAYRIVQEALTNALKHAGPARARVLVRYGETDVELEVVDDGVSTQNGGGAGQGLAGMRERAAVYGGRVDSGPRPEGGFRVTARLPA